MNSIPVAMTWETLARGRWFLLLATLGAIAFPALVLGALKRDGALIPGDVSLVIMHICMTLVAMAFCGAALIHSQGRLSRLYAHPVRTSHLVAWRLLPSMAILFVQIVVIGGTINAIFKLDWPIWGPALFAAAAFAAFAAVIWVTEKVGALLLITTALVALALGVWFWSRYGTMRSGQLHLWHAVTSVELLTMAGVAVAAYAVAVKGVARNRRGEAPLELGIAARLDRLIDSNSSFNSGRLTPLQAQFRYEWDRKGWLMPIAVAVCMSVALAVWFIVDRDAKSLLVGFAGGGAMLSALGAIGGLIFGNAGTGDSDFAMKSFTATRPLGDADLARAVLRCVAASVFVSWLVWAIPFVMLWCVVSLGGWLDLDRLNGVVWQIVPAAALALWAITGTITSVVLLGRAKALVILAGTSITSLVAASVISTTRSVDVVRAVQLTFLTFLSIGIVLTTLGLFVVARRRGFIRATTAWFSFAAWGLLLALVGPSGPYGATDRLLHVLLLAAGLALVFLPLAAAPLAVSTNRHR